MSIRVLESFEAERYLADQILEKRLHDAYWESVERALQNDDEYELWASQFDNAYYSAIEAGEHSAIEQSDPSYQQWIRDRDQALFEAFERGEIPTEDADYDLPY